MKSCRLLVCAFVSVFLPVLPAEEKPAPPPAVQVTIKRTKLPSGEKLDEVTTTTAIIGGEEVEGTLSINVGTPEEPRYWTVEFDASEGVAHISVRDASRVIQGMREGTSWVHPVTLYQINAPFEGSGTVTIYRTKTESLTLEISPPTAAAPEEKPEAE